MYKTVSVFLLAGLVLFVLVNPGSAQDYTFDGMVTGWFYYSAHSDTKWLAGLRYIPEFSFEHPLSNRYTFDLEASMDVYLKSWEDRDRHFDTHGEIDPYRFWARFSSSRFEARFGLQKINFGSASILRPLMWFDRIDPRDPLQLTDGVYGALFRYYFQNNSNLWIWTLYGNEDTKGWESISTQDETIEIGGRAQMPLLTGEIALTYHHRRIEIGYLSAPEHRFGLDGKWDAGVGLWFEAAFFRQQSGLIPLSWQRALTLGLDYTFPMGNGLYVLSEHFIFEASEDIFSKGEGIKFSALSISYPIGLLDKFDFFLYWDWKNNDLYNFVSLSHTTDNWVFYLMGFWNPETFQIYQQNRGGNMFAGKGVQIMVVFNH